MNLKRFQCTTSSLVHQALMDFLLVMDQFRDQILGAFPCYHSLNSKSCSNAPSTSDIERLLMVKLECHLILQQID